MWRLVSEPERGYGEGIREMGRRCIRVEPYFSPILLRALSSSPTSPFLCHQVSLLSLFSLQFLRSGLWHGRINFFHYPETNTVNRSWKTLSQVLFLYFSYQPNGAYVNSPFFIYFWLLFSIVRFVKLEDRKRALVSRLLQYALVHQLLGIPFHQIIIKRTVEGKPYLVK